MLPLVLGSAALGVGGGLLAGNDAKKQARRRAAAIQRAQTRIGEIADQESQQQYAAGAVRQGSLLEHLQRLASGEQAGTATQDADARTARIASLAGAPSAPHAGTSPGQQVAAAAAGQAGRRAGLVNSVDLVRALLGSQDRGRMASARTSSVRASRAAVPLQEALYRLARERAQVQTDLQSELGSVGPGWGGVLGQVLQGASIAPLALA